VSSSAESSATLSPVEAAFAEFLALAEEATVDFEAFSAARPALQPELRRLHQRWRAFDEAVSAELRPDSEPAPGDTADASADRLLRGLRRQAADESRYDAKGEIGRGGMGRVLKVWDRDLRRSLAMKVLLDGRKRDPRSLARFLDEALVTGQLEHPGIVPVHELGLDAEGRVYFTMPFVRGESLRSILERVRSGEQAAAQAAAQAWTRARVLEVLLRVCEAVGYAHARGVVHRDLKPDNVMVGPFGETYVMDWGLARLCGDSRGGAKSGGDSSSAVHAAVSRDLSSLREEVALEEERSPLTTMAGDVVGTPIYMAPEQAHGWIDKVGPATDVYSIGAMLYELLTGRQPYLTDGRDESAETVLRAVKSRAPRPVHALAGDVPPELEAVCDKAMARDPAERYPSTMELAGDLRAFLERRVVGAYQTGAAAELRMWIVRNRWLAASAGSALAAVVLGLVVGTVLFLRARRNEDAALEARALASDNASRLAIELRASNVERGRMQARFGPVVQGEELLWTEFLKDVDDPHARWALWEMYARTPSLQTLRVDDGEEARVRLAPGGWRLTFGDGGRLRTWRPGEAEPRHETVAHTGGAGSLELSPDGAIAATVGSDDGLLRLWSIPELTPIATVTADASGTIDVAFAPDGGRLAVCGTSGLVAEYTLPGLDVVREFETDASRLRVIRYGADGALLAFGGLDGDLWLWRGGSAAPERAWSASDHRGITALVTTPDGRIVTGGTDRRIAVLNAEGELLLETPAENGTIRDLVVTEDGDELIAAGWYRVDFRDAHTLELTRSYALPVPALDLALDPLGALVAVTFPPSQLRLFEREPGGHLMRLAGHAEAAAAIFHPDGRTIMTGDGEGVLRFFGADTGELLRDEPLHAARIYALDVSADGSVLATGDVDGTVSIRHLPTDRVLLEVEGLHLGTRVPMDLSADGTLFAMIAKGARARVLEVASGAELASVDLRTTEGLSVSLLAGDGLFATIGREQAVRLWTLAGEPAGLLPTEGTPWTVEHDARGRLSVGTWRWLVYVTAGPRARDWERRLKGHWGTVWHAVHHPRDPELLASASDDRTVRLWDLAGGRAVLTIETGELFPRAPSRLSFRPDGRALVISGRGDPVVVDLGYYDRHMAGNALLQMELLRDALGDELDEAAVRAWVAGVLAAPDRASVSGERR
jgi:WD40 repeat protein